MSAFEVEEGVLRLPAIEDAAVIGIEADYGEEELRLFVTIKDGHEIKADEIIAHCVQPWRNYGAILCDDFG